MCTADGIIFNIKSSGRLYMLYTISNNQGVTHSVNEWHKLLGHNNYTDILKLPDLVTGMSLASQSYPKD